jgi:hypothetical protein
MYKPLRLDAPLARGSRLVKAVHCCEGISMTPLLLGGSAELAVPCNTWSNGRAMFSPQRFSPSHLSSESSSPFVCSSHAFPCSERGVYATGDALSGHILATATGSLLYCNAQRSHASIRVGVRQTHTIGGHGRCGDVDWAGESCSLSAAANIARTEIRAAAARQLMAIE